MIFKKGFNLSNKRQLQNRGGFKLEQLPNYSRVYLYVNEPASIKNLYKRCH